MIQGAGSAEKRSAEIPPASDAKVAQAAAQPPDAAESDAGASSPGTGDAPTPSPEVAEAAAKPSDAGASSPGTRGGPDPKEPADTGVPSLPVPPTAAEAAPYTEEAQQTTNLMRAVVGYNKYNVRRVKGACDGRRGRSLNALNVELPDMTQLFRPMIIALPDAEREEDATTSWTTPNDKKTNHKS